jgi:hypothetical protein
MKYKSKRINYSTKVPKPKGQDWLFVDGTYFWLPPNKFTSLPLPPTQKLDLNITCPGWLIARSALDFILPYTLGNNMKYHIEWVKKIGDGLSKEAYRGDVTSYEEEEKYNVFAVSLILHDADANAGSRMIKEFYILDIINKIETSFSVPEPVGIIWVNGIMISVRSFVFGYPIELRAPRSNIERPWEIIGKIAADIHNMQIKNLPEETKLYSTRLDHAQSYLTKYKKYNIPAIEEALNWVSENLPKADKSVLVHSDLLGQNLFRSDTERISVLDWEYSFYGDPAYDLAIVTRGVKRPFQISGGLDYLVDSYLAAGGKQLTKKDVHIYELFLILGWYKQSLNRSLGGHGPEYYLHQLRNFLKRVDKH